METEEIGRQVSHHVKRFINRWVADNTNAQRLIKYAIRHLPVEDADAGSELMPPVYGFRCGEALGLDPSVNAHLAAAGSFYFTAADVADDVADGQIRRTAGHDVNDACQLLFLHQLALEDLDVPSAQIRALHRLFAEAGMEMAQGQALDLDATDVETPVDSIQIAFQKSGGEFGAFFAAPAILAGVDPEPWREFGRNFGALFQTISDYLDLFLDPDSDDWEAGKMTLPISLALNSSQAAAVRLLLCGDRSAFDRRRRGRWHLVQAGAADGLVTASKQLVASMQEAAARANSPKVLKSAVLELQSIVGGIVEALEAYAEDDPPPILPIAEELTDAQRSARVFLASAGLFEEAEEIHRHGLFGQPEVRGGLFGAALACALLNDDPFESQGIERSLIKLADPDGWRYYPGFFEIPTDPDCVGVMLQLQLGKATSAPDIAGIERLLLNIAPNGLIHTWMHDNRRYDRAEIDATWAGGTCPGATANALLGLWMHDKGGYAAQISALADAIAASIIRGDTSHFYTEAGIDFLVTRALSLISDGAMEQRWPEATNAVRARLQARICLSGCTGNTLEGLLTVGAAATIGIGVEHEILARVVVDTQCADGGYPADPFYTTVPHPVSSWYASRVVATAVALYAMGRLTVSKVSATA